MKDVEYINNLAKCAVNDDDAFSALYEYFFPRIYNFVFSKVKNSSVADDIVSEVFVKVFLNLQNYDATFAFSTWIFKIASDAVIDHFRKINRHPEEENWTDFIDATESNLDQPENQFLANESNRELLCALDKLNDRQRKIVELKFFGGLSNIEIVKILNLTPSNVGFINFQAMKKLREILQ